MASQEEQDRQRQERKARSEAILKAANIPILPHLPGIEVADEVTLRPAIEIARRAICTLLTAGKGGGVPQQTIDQLIELHGVAEFFTERERNFIGSPPLDREMLEFSWRSEASWTLLWALGFIDELGLPYDQIEPSHAVAIIEEYRLDGLAANPLRKSVDQILDEADLIFRCHWYTRDQELKGESPEPLDAGVAYERHYALNWLIGYQGQAWDDVSTDT